MPQLKNSGEIFSVRVFLILVVLCLLSGITSAWAQVIINEVDCDTLGTDTLEFVELYDGGAGNTALDGLVVVFYNGSGDVSNDAFDLDGYSTDGNGYFLLGNSGVSPTPSIIFSNSGLQNGADAVAIYTGNAADFPDGTSVTTTSLLDAIVYDTNDSDDTGLLVLLNAGQPQVNEDGAGDKDNHSNQRCPNGSGGARNTDTYIQATPTPGTDNNCPLPVATNIIINEVDCDTPDTDTLEFVELYDGGAGNTALDGLVVVFYNGSGDVSNDAFDLDGYSTDGNGYFLLGNSGVSPIPNIIFSNSVLQNGADAVALYIGDGTDFPNDTPVTTANLLDAIVYDTNDSDDTGLLVLLNVGQPQVNEDGASHSDTHSNQRCPNGSGGQRNTDNYTQNTPTPGGANNCANNPPTADAGPPQTAEVGDLVQLDASGSNDPDLGDTLSYSWSFTSKPTGSAAILSDPTAVNPTFTADEPGYYDLDLTVDDSHGGMDSAQGIVLAVYFLAPSSPRNVVINEVAWMGTTYRFQDEWLELYNNTDLPIDLTGWQLVTGDIYPGILLSGTIPPHSYFLLERTDDDSVSDIAADQVFVGVLNNPGAQQLFLLDPLYRVIDTVNGDSGPWPAGTTVPIGRYTMERIDSLEPDSDANWRTNDGITQNGTDAGGNPIHGTPKEQNSAINTPGVGGTKGDVNNDGFVDVLDARLCLQIAKGCLPGTIAQRFSADVDNDSDVDMDDARILAEYIVGIRTTLP